MTRIRAAGRADAWAVGNVHVETWRDTYAGVLPDRMLLKMSADVEGGRWVRALGRRVRVLVVEDDRGEIVGFGSCGRARGSSLPSAGEVYTLYILPDFQGAGLGRRLLGALFDTLERAGYGSALIWVLRENPSRYFYEAMGGRYVADREESLWGAPATEVAYGWDTLSPPCSTG